MGGGPVYGAQRTLRPGGECAEAIDQGGAEFAQTVAIERRQLCAEVVSNKLPLWVWMDPRGVIPKHDHSLGEAKALGHGHRDLELGNVGNNVEVKPRVIKCAEPNILDRERPSSLESTPWPTSNSRLTASSRFSWSNSAASMSPTAPEAPRIAIGAS
jgi:hypothetical protein